MLRIVLVVSSLALVLMDGGGCKKGESSGGEGSSGNGKRTGQGMTAKRKGAPGPLLTQTRTFVDDALKITAVVPKSKDWPYKLLGGNHVFDCDTGGFVPSRLMFMTTCYGYCASIGKNLEKLGKSTLKDFSGSSYSAVKLVKDEKLPDGRRIIVTGKYNGKDFHHYLVARWKPGWKSVAVCYLLLQKKHLALVAKFQKMCDVMRAAPK
jgi:hypothetical protein